MTGKRLDPIHPGEILAEEFLAPLGLSANALARSLGVPVTRISEILRGRRGVSADTALRLGRFFGTSPDLWLGLQAEYDLRVAERLAGAEIRRRIAPPPAAHGSLPYRTAVPAPAEVREPAAGYASRSGPAADGGGAGAAARRRTGSLRGRKL